MINEESLKTWEQEHIELLTSREMGEWLHRRDMNARPQGEWQPLPLKTINGDDIVAYESSCCGTKADKKYQYCPKCLAQMKGGAE